MEAKATLVFGDFRLELEGAQSFVGDEMERWSRRLPATLSPSVPAREEGSVEEEGGPLENERSAEKKGKRTASRPGGPSCASRIRDLIQESFFASPRKVPDIADRLREKATPYAAKHISAALIHTVQAGRLRRIREGGVWTYVNP